MMSINRIDVYAVPTKDGLGTLVGHIWPSEGWDAECFPYNDEEQAEILDTLENEYPHPLVKGGLLFCGVYT